MGEPSLEVRIRTLTPLWTGGIDGTMDRIHETGILGSLRWWYEAIVRGLGGYACDPTGDDRCPDRQGRYCDVCAVFGATGLQRAFRLEGPVWWNRERGSKLEIKMRNARDHRGWHLGRGFLGEATLQFVPLRLPEGWSWRKVWEMLSLTLSWIECWGGLGARTQQGYGVVEVEGLYPLNLDGGKPWPQQRRNRRDNIRHHPDRPSLDGFFSAKVRFSIGDQQPKEWLCSKTKEITSFWKGQQDKSPRKKNICRDKKPNNENEFDELDWYLHQTNSPQRSAVLPLASIVRFYLRNFARSNWNDQVRHRLLGEPGKKSLIHVSHAYPVNSNQWEFRIWGWIPESLPNGISRSNVLTNLRQWLGVSQQRQWHIAHSQSQNDHLWHTINISGPQICWFEEDENENTEAYLKALLQCDCEAKDNDAS